MIQAVNHSGTKNRTGISEQGGSHDQFRYGAPDVLSLVFSVVALVGFASLAFCAAHTLAAHCTSANVIDLMRACGTQVVVR